MSWWIPPQKQYLPDTDRWYCDDCEELTTIERNPDWDGSFRGDGEAPEWFVRCAVCKKQHYQNSGFDCPGCGWWNSNPDDESQLLERTDPEFSYWASMEFGGNPVDWYETWKCPVCGEVFTFKNGNY